MDVLLNHQIWLLETEFEERKAKILKNEEVVDEYLRKTKDFMHNIKLDTTDPDAIENERKEFLENQGKLFDAIVESKKLAREFNECRDRLFRFYDAHDKEADKSK